MKKKYNIIKQKTRKNEWRVIWDGVEVYRRTGPDAEFFVGAFVDGLERGLTGSKQPLYALSQVKIEDVIYGGSRFDEMDFE